MSVIKNDYSTHAGHTAAATTAIQAIITAANTAGFDVKFVEPCPADPKTSPVAGKEHYILEFVKQ
jgi:hypothetical protein